jgi:hypothetical protein
MKILSKIIIPLFLIIATLTSCSSFLPAFKTKPTEVMETAIAIAGTALAETQTAIPTQGAWNYEDTATVPITSVSNATQEEIASRLFTQWLDHFKTEKADSHYRLEDFELLSVAIEEKKLPDNFVAMVVFSVKPSTSSMLFWEAGNGIGTDGIWIRRKLLFIRVKKENDMYRLASMGTGRP